MSKLSGIALAAVVGLAFTANANAYNSGTIGSGTTNLTLTVPSGPLGASQSFTDIFNLTLSSASQISYQVTEKEVVFGYLSPTGPTLAQLYDIDDASLSYGLYSTLAPSTLITNLSNLSAGSYFFKVTGTSIGLLGGQYALKMGVSALPVPEPETNLMMLLGLTAIGTMVYRKKNA